MTTQEIRLRIMAEPGLGSDCWVIALETPDGYIASGSANKKRHAEFKALERALATLMLDALDSGIGEALRHHLRINKGAWKEWRLLAEFRQLGIEKPSWAKSMRRATVAEDAEGIDLVIRTNKGDIGIQVKSSTEGIAKFLTKKKRHILIVHFPDGGDARRILFAALRKIERRLKR